MMFRFSPSHGSFGMMRKQVSTIASTLVLTGCIIGQNVSPKAIPSLGDAQKSFAGKQYKEAAAQCALIAAHANDPQLRLNAFLLEAKSLINVSDFPSAETVLNKYLYGRPLSSEALYLLGYVLERENKPRESLAVYTRAADLAPPQPNDLKLVALDYVLLNDYSDAVVWFKRCLADDPANSEAWYFLGRAHMERGDFVEAEKDFHHTLALTPNDSKALNNLGLSLEAQNRTDEAIKAYSAAVSIQKDREHESEQPLLNLGTLLNNENHFRDALLYLAHAVEVAPGSARCHEELSRALTATGDSEQGILAMERAVALDKANPRLHFLLGQLYRKAGQTAKASAEFQTSKRLYGSHSTKQ
jgi:Flp pilus assembly protein TadD